VKRIEHLLLEGTFLSPLLCLVVGCIFGLLLFVLARSQGMRDLPPYGIALVGGLIMAAIVYFAVLPPAHADHHVDTH
jgi:uncharacterized membrane protein